MFAFAGSELVALFPVPIAMLSTWGQIVIATVAAVFLWRLARRRPRHEARPRRRRGFSWVALLLLLVIGGYFLSAVPRHVHEAIDHLGPHHPHSHFSDHGFPPVKQKDLWALRRAVEKSGEKAADVEATEAERPEPAADVSHVQLVAGRNGSKASISARIPPDVARTIADARQLAERAVAEARLIYAKSRRDASVLARLAKPGDQKPEAPALAPAPEAAPAAPAPSEVAAAPEAPPSPPPAPAIAPATAAVEAPAANTAPAPVAVAPIAQEMVVAAETPVAALRPIRQAERPAQRSTKDTTIHAHRSSTKSHGTESLPPWLAQGTGLDGDTYYQVVSVEHYKTRGECEDALQEKLQGATRSYIDRYLGPGASALVRLPQAFIHENLVSDEHEQIVDTGDPLLGEMTNLHVRLAYDRRMRTHLQRMWRAAQTENRLLGVAGSAAGVLLVLGTVFSYLRLDTMTRGYYTRRLQLLAAVVILPTVGGVVSYWSNYLVKTPVVPLQVSPEAVERQIVPMTPVVGGRQSYVRPIASRRNPT